MPSSKDWKIWSNWSDHVWKHLAGFFLNQCLVSEGPKNSKQLTTIQLKRLSACVSWLNANSGVYIGYIWGRCCCFCQSAVSKKWKYQAMQGHGHYMDSPNTNQSLLRPANVYSIIPKYNICFKNILCVHNARHKLFSIQQVDLMKDA